MKSNGWTLYWYPAFREQFEKNVAAVEAIAATRPEDLASSERTKVLRRVLQLTRDEIPTDPAHSNYVQGNTLGPSHSHWRRAKFMRRFRLFFRFSTTSKIIIYAWVNDENTLRQAGGKNDPYAVFSRRLKKGDPPSDWKNLLEASTEIDTTYGA